jgi:hypothetical protein|tara:strand:+ start:781 stop:915 length:135 start_codon:yes stop_codon:yes gene_type:complete
MADSEEGTCIERLFAITLLSFVPDPLSQAFSRVADDNSDRHPET